MLSFHFQVTQEMFEPSLETIIKFGWTGQLVSKSSPYSSLSCHWFSTVRLFSSSDGRPKPPPRPSMNTTHSHTFILLFVLPFYFTCIVVFQVPSVTSLFFCLCRIHSFFLFLYKRKKSHFLFTVRKFILR